MRECLCKANRKDNGEVVEGCLLKDYVTGQYFIHAKGNSVNESDLVNENGYLKFVAFEVDQKTICYYTGKTDIKKNMVWEHDIVKQFADCDELKHDSYFFYEIVWNDRYARFEGHCIYSGETVLFDELEDIEVVDHQRKYSIKKGPYHKKEETMNIYGLKQIRMCRGLSQSELSIKSGVSLRTLQDYETNKRHLDKANVSIVLSLSRALNVTIEQLIAADPDATKVESIMNYNMEEKQR